jgi:hypothetical protein
VRLILEGNDAGRGGLKRLKALATKKLPDVERTLKRARLMKRYLIAAQDCSCPSLETCLLAARRAGIGLGTHD